MDAVLLSRLQFAISASFHFIFPATTLGLTLLILILETLYLKKKNEICKDISNLLIKILGIVFVMGTATGITLEFSFGTNWAKYSRVVGDIFGVPLAAEGVLAFFLESVFIGVLVFGRKRVSKTFFWWSSFFVFLGSHLSGVWIIIANSWMQTPSGYKIENGIAKLTNVFDAIFNPSFPIRYFHIVIASWITGSLLCSAISSYYLLKKKNLEEAKVLLRISIAIFVFSSMIQIFSGHIHSVQVAKTQPSKMAAFEALWKSQEGAHLIIFGIPSEKEEKVYLKISIPKLLSFLIHFDSKAKVKGFDELPPEDKPSVFLPFVGYHIMIIIGLYFVGLSILSIYLMLRRKLFSSKLFQKLIILSVAFPYISNEAGWIAAETGRQPWAVYHIIKTKEAISPVVPPEQILITLTILTVLYTILTILAVKFILRIIRKGFKEIETGY